ncbi:hypothetical protein [Planobispora rosea]|uniref:hypothetical protein n=1 Tax=Planobispora rosea TaxID=35762 RepID=UPI00083AB4B7|nr:hypothetical protein [Planobispora rosea]
MRIRSIFSAVILAGGSALFCQAAHATASDARQDTVVVTDIVDYLCTAVGTGETQAIKVRIELTMPTDAVAGEQMSIGWRGTYVNATGLKAPSTGLAAGSKLYAYAAISDLPRLTSATGVSELTTPDAGEAVPLPQTAVPLKTTSSNAGTATVRPAALNIGVRPNEPSIECEVRNVDALTTYSLTVAPADGQPTVPVPVTPTQTATATAGARPTRTVTATVTAQPVEPAATAVTEARAEQDGGTMRTPLGGAATGGGGAAGPDGRVLMSAGFLLTLAAVSGLLLRRRSVLRRP